MPRRVLAYACEYRCGFKIYTRPEPIRKHEPRCLRNPARKACVTCRHTGKDWDDFREWYTCEVDKLPEDKNCIVECAFHQVAEE
jgi:hypothetical protein